MVLSEAVRSRLVPRLRPWLREEPVVMVELGFLRSEVKFRNLVFDLSELNRLVRDSTRTRVVFKSARIDELSFWISPWSSPTVSVQARGARIVLAPRDDESRPVLVENYAEKEFMNVLASLDHEGVLIHDVIRDSLLAMASSRNRFLNALMNSLLQRLKIYFKDVSFELELIEGSYACLLKANELSLDQLREQSCLLSGFIGDVILSQKDIFLSVGCNSLEFGLKESDHDNCIASARELSACIRLKNRQIVGFDVSIPRADFRFSSSEIPVVSIVLKLFSPGECKGVRSGRELWRIAAGGIDRLLFYSKVSLYRLFINAIIWTKYVRAYESLLLMAGFCKDGVFKKNGSNWPGVGRHLVHANHQLGAVHEIEKKLLPQSVASARKVARQRALLQSHNCDTRATHIAITSSMEILAIFKFFQNIVYYIFGLTIHFLLFVWNCLRFLHGKRTPLFDAVSSVGTPLFIVNVEELWITLSPSVMTRVPTNPNESVDTALPDSDLFSLSIAVNTLNFVSTKGLITQSSYVALGELRVYCSAYSRTSYRESRLDVEKFLSHKSIASGDCPQMILWSEPALFSSSKEVIDHETTSSSSRIWLLIIKNCLDELQAGWNKICQRFEQSNMHFMHNPFVLYGLMNVSVDPSFNLQDYGLPKCCITVGLLNLELGESIIMPIFLLFRQMQQSLHQCDVSLVPPTSTVTRETTVQLEEKLEFYKNELKLSLLNITPKRELQIGVLAGGANLKISCQGKKPLQVRKQNGHYPVGKRHSDSEILVNVDEITLALWPASKDFMSVLHNPEINEQEPNYRWLRKPPVSNIPEEHISYPVLYHERITHNVFWSLRGLHASIKKISESMLSPLIDHATINLQSSICRDHLFSLFSTTDVLSIALSGILGQTAAVLHIEDLYALSQEFESICSLQSPIDIYPKFGIVTYPEELARRFLKPNNLGSSTVTFSQDNSLSHKNVKFSVDAYFDIESIDVILNDSKKQQSIGWSDVSSSSNPSRGNFMAFDLSSLGLGVFVKKLDIHLLCGKGDVRILTNLYGLESVIFLDHDNCAYTDLLKLKAQDNQSFNMLYKFSQSACVFSLFVCHNDGNLPSKMKNTDDLSTSTNSIITYLLPHWAITNEDLEAHIGDLDKEMLLACLPSPNSKIWILFNCKVGKTIIAEHHMMNLLDAACQNKGLHVLLSISEEPYAMHCVTKGGDIFLETLALAAFVKCFRAYYLSIKGLVASVCHSSQDFGKDSDLVYLRDDLPSQKSGPTGSFQDTASPALFPETWKLLLVEIAINISQCKIIFAVADSSGGLQELVIEADAQLQLVELGRRFAFEISRLTVLSHHLQLSKKDKVRFDVVPHFHSNKPSDLPSLTGTEERASTEIEDSYGTFISNSQSIKAPGNGVLHASHGSCILKHLVSSISFENKDIEVGPQQLKSYWVGSGSISGFDVVITLSEIQMLLDLGAPLSKVFAKEVDYSLNFSGRQNEGQSSSDQMIADGAIVAIQDIHQHMYFAVENVGRKYCLIGVLHYSLVGEKALFKVKYHSAKKWRSASPRFFLMSLHAKNDGEEPLCLNFRPGSGFVEISNCDRNTSLWETLPYIADSHEKDDGLKFFGISCRKAFHLVNSKCQCAVAFVDGFPEFVKKPGNPFKVNVFHESDFLTDSRGMIFSRSYIHENVSTDFQGNSFGGTGLSWQIFNLLTVTIDRVTLTIFHKVSDVNEKFPLIQGYIDGFHVTGQSFPTKFRLIGSFKIAAFCFDPQQNSWSEFVSPVETSLFFRTRFTCTPSENEQRRVPVHFYFSFRQIDISLSELSLDILLFLLWKVGMISPYAVRKSVIYPNFCKVENKTGLNLLCNCSNNQETIVPGKQSFSIVVSGSTMGKDPLVSLRLSKLGSFSTSPIQICPLKPCLFAWRTRITSVQGSRTFPGPFLVVDVSKKSEDGLMIVLSPLLCIHNESGFSMRLRIQRPNESESDSALVFLRNGDLIDDSMEAFDALNYSGGLKKTLMSLGLGNFLLSIKPEIFGNFKNSGNSVLVDWSEDLKGGKAVRISRLVDKLSYGFKKTFGMASVKSLFSMICCPLFIDGIHASDLFFLIQTIGREVPVLSPQNMGVASQNLADPMVFQLQKEIFILPTICVTNYLQTEIIVAVSNENHSDLYMIKTHFDFGKHATIACGSSASFYVDPSKTYITVTLCTFNSKCKPVNSGDCVTALHRQKREANHVDVDLDFGGGKQIAKIRFSHGDRGILEASVFTLYTLQNNTDLSLCCFAHNQKNVSRYVALKYNSSIPPEVGLILPPKSSRSWFLKSNKLLLQHTDKKASEVLLDLDALSSITELSLETQNEAGISIVAKLGVSLAPIIPKMLLPSQTVYLVPRYIISNESDTSITIRQCYLEDDCGGLTTVEGNGKAALEMRTNLTKRREADLFDTMLKKHRNETDDSTDFIQFRLEGIESSWSGPICIASLGRFFLKFKKLESSPKVLHSSIGSKQTLFANVHIVEQNSSLVLHFHMPPNCPLPYRIENCLQNAAISYHQKDSVEPETLGSGCFIEYAWDDLNLPHKLVIQIAGINALREVNIDKVHTWKPFLKTRHRRSLGLHLPFDTEPGIQSKYARKSDLDMLSMGYEVLTDGLTRVLRVCEFSNSYKEEKILVPLANIQLKISCLSIKLLEENEQDGNSSELKSYSTVLVARLMDISLDSVVREKSQYNCVMVKSINMDEKWQGAPFASMIRRSHINDSSMNGNMLCLVLYITSSKSGVRHVKYSSIVLQPVDLNLDEETLMHLLKFWRASVSASETPCKMFYFEHFEIHPIKIRATFLPGNQYSNYSSAQEALRSFLHNVIKVPNIKDASVELNGILLTHALLTTRELGIKCAQHYSWYLIRAVYKAKGSTLLPPVFASVFDDSASSSLDIFFDPSDGSINIPGLTLGMFKFVRTCISSKGFSGTKRYMGDLGKTVKRAGSNVLFAAITEISDNVILGAETNGFRGMVSGFHQGILKLAMEPAKISAAFMEGGPDRRINLDRNPGIDELYIEGYLQGLLDVKYKQEYLRVRVNGNQVLLKNLPPSSSLIDEIVEEVNSFLISKGLLKGEASTARSIRQLRSESEWKLGPTVLTLCEHLFVSFAIRMLRKHTSKFIVGIRLRTRKNRGENPPSSSNNQAGKPSRIWVVCKFALTGVVAYVDGRLCRHIPNSTARRIVSGFLLSFLDKENTE